MLLSFGYTNPIERQRYVKALKTWVAAAAIVALSGAAQAALVSLGDGTVKDTNTNLIWLQDWNLNGLHKPPSVHLAITLRHTQEGVADRFLGDLGAAVEHTRAHPNEQGGMAPVYGMANSLPVQGVVTDLLER